MANSELVLGGTSEDFESGWINIKDSSRTGTNDFLEVKKYGKLVTIRGYLEGLIIDQYSIVGTMPQTLIPSFKVSNLVFNCVSLVGTSWNLAPTIGRIVISSGQIQVVPRTSGSSTSANVYIYFTYMLD